MSLGLWMFDWTWPGETPPPEPTPAVTPTGAGGGSRLDDDFWEVRERYIARMLQVTDEDLADAPTVAELESLDALSPERLGSEFPTRDVGPSPYASISFDRALELQARAVYLARDAATRAELQHAGALIAATSRALARLKDQHEMENLATVMVLMF